MRVSLPAILLFSTLLTACAFKGDIPPSTHIPQNSQLKVDPSLLGQPVPAKPPQPASSQPAAGPVPIATSAPTDAPIKMDPVGLRTQRSIYFDLNSAAIKAEFDAVLRAHARHLTEHPKARVRIEGNADERGTVERNERLGKERAESVQAALLAHGATKNQLSTKTLGASNPKKTGHNEGSWAENRRADLVYEREE